MFAGFDIVGQEVIVAENGSVSRAEIQHIKDDIIEIKQNAREQNKDMLDMRDSKIRTEIALDGIKKMQDTSNVNQAAMLAIIQALKDEPFNVWKKLNGVWKTVIVSAVASQVIGTIIGYMKLLAK